MADRRKAETWVVRTPPGMKDELAEVARKAGVDRNKLVVGAIERLLGKETPRSNGARHTCNHPKEKRRQLGYVTLCECGVRL